ncbi:hypothetical protein CIB48_g1046 [Xylaria polymorpha]|nr:hypothetical protein CIB48_g1046 [Xylaria polymorpha]
MASSAASLSSSSLHHHYQQRQPHPSLSRPAKKSAVVLDLRPPQVSSHCFERIYFGAQDPPNAPDAAPAPGKGAGLVDDFAVGDQVDVPGNMVGTIRFVGSVAGRKGVFAGVELLSEYALRGKNSGDVDGVSYFATSVPGAGIFVPINKLSKPDLSASFPNTPSGLSLAGLRAATQNTTNYTPPTPSLPKFSHSVGPGRAPSPQGKRSRTSLPRPDSPVRKLQLTSAPRPTIATPAKPPSRYGSPTIPKFGSSVRGTAGDPNKSMRLDRRPSIAPRSVSALGQTIRDFDDDEPMPPPPVSTSTHIKANGSIGSIASSMGFKRPASRANHANEEEVERLKSQLEDRDRQLKEQASALAEMESSLSELTVLIDQTDNGHMRSSSLDGKDTSQLRAVLREKNEKIAMLTAEFDAHRADFRSTIDTLEMASTETQRVYDAKIRELEQELQEVQERHSDVESVAQQLKQLEELVQELEEGLEDARRGEAEARGEVEFLRGEVERTRSELRREREKASDAMNEAEIPFPDLSLQRKPPTQPQRTNSFAKTRPDSIDNRMTKDKLERELVDLRSLLDKKNSREEELEREIETLRRRSVTDNRGSSMTVGSADRSSYRDSKGTVILARDPRSSEETHKRNQTLDPMPESDTLSSVTENSTLWCEICETSGHDILTCTNMFGGQAEGKPNSDDQVVGKTGKDAVREGLRSLAVPIDAGAIPRPLSPMRPKTSLVTAPVSVPTLPNPQDSGPLAGKESGIIDPSKWCAMCERDGHDSIDCPLEDAF